MQRNSEIEAFWQAYLDSLPEGSEQPVSYQAWYFSDNQKDADELGELASAGIKTATSSLLWEYEAENEALPEAGGLNVVTNWAGEPLCIIETREVRKWAFNEVDEAFARDEGEGDRSLSYWRKVHREAFKRTCAAIGREPAENMPVVSERFRVVFPLPG